MTYHGLRVAFITSADSFRGSAVSYQHLAEGLRDRSATVQVFTGHPAVTGPLRAAGIDVVELNLRSTNPKTALQLRRALRLFRAEVLVVDRPRDLRLGLLATAGTKVALVDRYNAHGARPASDLLTRIAYRFFVRQTIFLTHEMAHRVYQAAPWMARPNHRVIPEGVCLRGFRPDSAAGRDFRERHALGNRPFVLAVGALTSEKRTAMIVDAVRQVPERPLLVLCGEGPLRPSLERQAELLDVPVRFLGLLPRAELLGAYNAASVVAHACAVETFGLSVLEAMACGAPVVGVRSGGVREVVGESGDAGLLVDAEDAGAMARAIHSVLADPALAAILRAGARARAMADFSLEKMADAYDLATVAAFLLTTST
jgi:glycosyltransferase involved in cell wall biosynthesis